MADVRGDTPVYPIGVVRKLTGLSDRQIRYYEHVGLLQPARTEGRRRMYSQNEVELLLKIRAQMDRGLRTEEIRQLLGIGRRHQTDQGAGAPIRATLPHFAGGESVDESEPDVETRRAYMTRQTPRRKP